MSIDVIQDESAKVQFDGLALKNRDPNKVYRFSHKRDMAISRHEFNGYEVCDKERDSVRSILSDRTRMKKGEDLDTTIALGDLLLMQIDRGLHEQRMKEEGARARRFAGETSSSYHQAIRKAHPSARPLSYEEHSESRGMNSVTQSEHEEMERVGGAKASGKVKV